MSTEKNPDHEDLVHIGPEMAVAEADVHPDETGTFVRGTSLWRDAWRRLLEEQAGGVWFGGSRDCHDLVDHWTNRDQERLRFYARLHSHHRTIRLTRSFPPFTGPDGEFSLGRIRWELTIPGRDQLARVLQGGQISLFVGILSTLVSLLIGVSYGAIAGYVGGRVDNVMMRIVDVLYSLPYVIVVIVLLSMFRSQTPRGQLMLLFIALGSVSWLTMARIVRGQVLSLKNQEFVLAARATGVSNTADHLSTLVPNTLGPVIVYATLTIPQIMLTEAFLSFLGFGVQAPLASWGSLAADGIQNIAIFPWQLIFPGRDDGADALLAELPGRWIAGRARSADEDGIGPVGPIGPIENGEQLADRR